MILKINGLQLRLHESESVLVDKLKKILKLPTDKISFTIYRRSVDARKKDDIHHVYQLLVEVDDGYVLSQKQLKQNISIYKPFERNIVKGVSALVKPPIIVGFGPCGLFTAYILAQEGYRPIVIERGSSVDVRREKVAAFWKTGILDEETNVQFGEGGAGAFSDGKLTTRVKDSLIEDVLSIFVENGAPKEILYEQKPHIGTDLLLGIIASMRKRIIDWGGVVEFDTRLTSLSSVDGQYVLKTNRGTFVSEQVVLALGNSARDTFEMLDEWGLTMESKPFAVGFRIEHPQNLINQGQFGEHYHHPRLGPAEYALTHKGDRGVYTFCMCPGGKVIAAASTDRHLVVNGMSHHARDMVNANSAIVATVDSSDYGSGVLDGMRFQQAIEQKAFDLGGGNWYAPCQQVQDFLKDRPSVGFIHTHPSYKPGVTPTSLNDIYPPAITDAIKEGIIGMDRKLKGFGGESGVLTGVETRTSSPVRMVRDKVTLEALGHSGLYPGGEGAGYAGGITSSAIDGIKIAEIIASQYKPF